MEINFKGPVMPVDPYSQMAFVEILNILLTAGHIVDVNRFLINRNANPLFGSLSGYFRWSFSDNHFTLWQRVEYNSPLCFSRRIFSIHFGMLANRDRKKRQYGNELKTYQYESPGNYKNGIQCQNQADRNLAAFQQRVADNRPFLCIGCENRRTDV